MLIFYEFFPIQTLYIFWTKTFCTSEDTVWGTKWSTVVNYAGAKNTVLFYLASVLFMFTIGVLVELPD